MLMPANLLLLLASLILCLFSQLPLLLSNWHRLPLKHCKIENNEAPIFALSVENASKEFTSIAFSDLLYPQVQCFLWRGSTRGVTKNHRQPKKRL